MPSFVELVTEAMPMLAARNGGRQNEVHGDFRAAEPSPTNDNGEGMPSEACVLDNRIWQFAQRASKPGCFEDVKVWSRGMGMNYSHGVPVLREIEFSDVVVKREDGTEFRLPLEPEFVVQRFAVDGGSIPKSDIGLWQLEARTDVSLLVAFAYEEVGGNIVPMPLADILALGASFMPAANLPPPCLDILATDDMTARVCIDNVRYLVLVSLTTCRERSDFAPGDLNGFARFYPHAMVMANLHLDRVEVEVTLERPAKAMTHGDPEMGAEVKALLVTDSNKPHGAFDWIPGAKNLPVPVTSNIYDYYLVDPDRRLGASGLPREVTLADHRRDHPRRIASCVAREGGEWESIEKEPRQGQFDNVHLAPRMRLAFAEVTPAGELETKHLDEIVMTFICLHDCVHMHVRWAAWAGEKATRGFRHGLAYAADGAPGVPENQSVFARFPNSHTMVYRAQAHQCREGAWQVFCHHGAAYAVDEWPGTKAAFVRGALRRAIDESDKGAVIYPNMPLARKSWASFYWRCRWRGAVTEGANPTTAMERLEFALDRVLR